MAGIVRSGQVLQVEGNLVFFGDVNPGGSIVAGGDIFVLGSLRGTAHAGKDGNRQAVIASSHFQPTHVRIADAISRPPDEWEISDAAMMFAYLKDEHMEIEKSRICIGYDQMLSKYTGESESCGRSDSGDIRQRRCGQDDVIGERGDGTCLARQEGLYGGYRYRIAQFGRDHGTGKPDYL